MFKRLALTGLLMLLALSGTALADTITMRFSGGTAVAQNNISNDPVNGGTPSNLDNVVSISGLTGSVTFTTGELASADLVSLFNGGGSISITSDGSGGLPVGTIFQGTFGDSGTWQLVAMVGNTAIFEYNGPLSGVLSPGLLAALGLDPSLTDATGTIRITISFEGGSTEGYIQSGEIILTATPEPATLALFGSGLLAVAGAVRRRKRAAQG